MFRRVLVALCLTAAAARTVVPVAASRLLFDPEVPAGFAPLVEAGAVTSHYEGEDVCSVSSHGAESPGCLAVPSLKRRAALDTRRGNSASHHPAVAA